MTEPPASPAHSNRLALETSPYLLQHAHNPVDWYAWGEEAWERARREDKPVLVSVGYAACHWCHVMEHESFESEEIAALQNDLIVSIKVDREERPDIDEIYMDAIQMIHGQGGWPLNIFCTPEGKPFFGGTYFPPVGRTGMPSWPDVLRGVDRAYREQRDQVEQQATQIVQHLDMRFELAADGSSGSPKEMLATAAGALMQSADATNGGFGGAPKFPQPYYLSLLLRQALAAHDAAAQEHVLLTLRKMAEGGIYDQLAGGFHRYAVDAIWLVPHFEKMLYDNALLLPLYLDAWRLSRDVFFRRIAEETAGYLLREMTAPEGAFFASTDADSEGEEGKFFVWTREELMEVLDDDDSALVSLYWGVDEGGNFEGKSILNVAMPLAEAAGWHEKTEDEAADALARARRELLAVRATRVPPQTDTKIIVAWNGLAIDALARAGAVLDEPRYVEAAATAARFILEALRLESGLLRIYAGGRASVPAFLEDYAALADGLITLYEASGDEEWFGAAQSIIAEMNARYWDEEHGGFFTVARDGEQLVARRKPAQDGATPSGNSLAASALARLYALTSDGQLADRIEAMRGIFGVLLERAPTAMGLFVTTLEWLENHQAVAVVGDENRATEMLREVWSGPPRPTVVMQRGTDAATEVPQLLDKNAVDGSATAYVCHGFACSAPVTTPEALRELLDQPAPA